MLTSIVARITAAALAIIVAAVGVNFVATELLFRRHFSDAILAKAEAAGLGLAAQLDRLRGLGLPLDELVGFDAQCREALDLYPELSEIAVFARDGRLLFGAARDADGPAASFPALPSTAASEGVALYEQGGDGRLQAIVPASRGEDGGFEGAIVVSVPASVLSERLDGLRGMWLLLTASVLLAASAALVALNRRLLSRPLAELLAAIRLNAEQEEMLRPVRIAARDELGVIAAAFNTMIDRIAASRAALMAQSRELEEMVAELLALNDLEARYNEVVESRRKLQAQARELETLAASLAEARDAAEAATRAKADFLANMSHEIRTPLNGVLGMLSILLSKTLDADHRRFAETAQRSAEMLLTLINDVLDYSKLEAGQVELEDIDFGLEEAIDDVVTLMTVRAEEKGLSLVAEIEAGAPLVLGGDVNRLRQVLFNLVGNAIKFTEVGGVTIGVSHRPLDDGAVEMRIAVRDTGCGIDEEGRRRLFRRFSQADSSTTRRFGGTGLGLAISRQLVELMGGEIGVESEPGAGATFWFTFRARPGSAAPAPAAPPSQACGAPARRLRILAADDNAVNRMVVEEMILAAGHDVVVVSNGQEALSAVQAEPFDLVLMDMQMPVMDGSTATTMIRRLDGPVARIPIIALTANAMPGDRETYLALGATGYLSKPFTPEKLAQAIATATGSGADSAA